MRNLIALFSLIFLGQSVSAASIEYFEQQWRRQDDSMGLWYTYSDNKADALLGNSQDVVLDSYLAMFRGTNNDHYLRRFIEQMDITLSKRDDLAGTTDYSGKSRPVWSTRKGGYVTDTSKAYGFLVESGNLSYPMADFAQIVINGPEALQKRIYSPGRSYLQIAEQYRDRAAETYFFHMERFHTDTIDGLPIGWFSSAPDATFLDGIAPGKPYPLNYATSMGRTAIMLSRAFKGAGAFDQTAIRIAGYALLEMEYHTGNDSYSWSYYPRMPYYPAGYVDNYGNTNADDIYHAAITIEFLGLMKKHNLGVIYATEFQRLARTFLNNLVQDPAKPYQFNFLVDGKNPGSSGQYLNEAGMFLYTADSSNSVATVVEDALVKWLGVHNELKGASGHRSFAHLIRYLGEKANGIRYP